MAVLTCGAERPLRPTVRCAADESSSSFARNPQSEGVDTGIFVCRCSLDRRRSDLLERLHRSHRPHGCGTHGGRIQEPKPSDTICSAQLSGRSARLVKVSAVRSTGWLPARTASTISGAKKASGMRRLT